MMTEIHVEDVGTIRQLNVWQIEQVKANRSRRGDERLTYALAAGMTLRQFKRLSPDKQAEVQHAYRRLTSPSAIPLGDFWTKRAA